jgi:hypothetical protein
MATETPMTEAELKMEARLLAIEYLVGNLYVLMFRMNRKGLNDISAAHQILRQQMSRETIPGADPVQADQMLAEMQTAVERILASIEEMAAAAQRTHR